MKIIAPRLLNSFLAIASIAVVGFIWETTTVNSQKAIATEIKQQQDYFPNREDETKYQNIINSFARQNLATQPLGDTVQQIAEQFLGAKYTAGLLDKSPQETLIISLKEFDCMLFLETVLAIASNLTSQNYGYRAFSAEVESQRYWNGKMNGYCSRLHYFSDWLEDNQRRGKIKNITRKLGGVDTLKKINFMTSHRSSYPNLAKSDANFKCIAGVETSLSDDFNYIPTKNIDRVYAQLKPGDIIGVATNIAGLDFTHTGFVYHQSDNNVGLIHASPVGKVVISSDLQSYISRVPNAIGIVVARTSQN